MKLRALKRQPNKNKIAIKDLNIYHFRSKTLNRDIFFHLMTTSNEKIITK